MIDLTEDIGCWNVKYLKIILDFSVPSKFFSNPLLNHLKIHCFTGMGASVDTIQLPVTSHPPISLF
jgi:hypothetical protein